jgi:hypothetical protein
MEEQMRTRRATLDDPPFLTRFPMNLGLRMLGPGVDAMRPSAEQREAYLRYTQMGDPLADALVQMFRRLPTGEGRRLFETALEHGIGAVEDPPEELTAFFAEVDAVPYWVDQHKLELASRVTGRTSAWQLGLVMTAFALNGGYLAARADKTLVGAGELSAIAPRRLTETAQWALDVIRPCGLERFAPGRKNILRVRLMHAIVRAGMNRREDWDHDAWDEPVNQSLSAGTLMLFSMGSILGCQTLGLRFTAKEKAAVYHFWRYVGHLMGIHPTLLPADEADTWRLLWLQTDYELIPDQDSTRLSQALVTALPVVYGLTGTDPLSRMARHVFVNYWSAYCKLMIGKTNADYLNTRARIPYTAAVLAGTAITAGIEIPRRTLPGATRLSEEIGSRAGTRLLERMVRSTQAEPTYRQHDQLASTGAA